MRTLLLLLGLLVPDRQPIGDAQSPGKVTIAEFTCGTLYREGNRLEMRVNEWDLHGWIKEDGSYYLLWQRRGLSSYEWEYKCRLDRYGLRGRMRCLPHGNEFPYAYSFKCEERP